VILAQTSASLFADDYDEVVTRRMSAGPAFRRLPRRRRWAGGASAQSPSHCRRLPLSEAVKTNAPRTISRGKHG